MSSALKSRLIRHNYTLNGMFSSFIVLSFLIIVALIYTEIVLPAVNRNFPIITDEKAWFVNQAVTDEGLIQLLAQVYANKPLPCPFIESSGRGEAFFPDVADGKGAWKETTFYRDPSNDQSRSKATGKQKMDLGIYVWGHLNLSEATHVRALAEHICNPEVTLFEDEFGKVTKTISGDHRVTINGPWLIQDIIDGVADKTVVH